MAVDEMVAFINARLDEIEQDAHACNDAPWDTLAWPNGTQIRVATYAHQVDPMRFRHMGHVATVEHAYDATHIARNDPLRVLADVKTRRQIVTELHAAIGRAWQFGEEARELIAQLAVLMLQRFAALDRDHPDYDPGWEA